ncbi:hypothetical protein D7X98_19050 [bacterium 1XD8-76]|nr:hypothetical protein D7X98_19050 [bacterium 1XD8-76]
MGKQTNYWLSYQHFLKIAQVALDCNCVIIKSVRGKTELGNNIEIVSENTNLYYFLPFETYTSEQENLDLQKLCLQCQIIEAGFSTIYEPTKEILRSRIYVGTGYYNELGQYISRSDVLTLIYNKLVRTAKKLAPLVELVDMLISTRDTTYLQEIEYRHKEYVSPEFLSLREFQCYKLKA